MINDPVLTREGSAAADDALLFIVLDNSLRNLDTYLLMSSAGSVDVEVTLNGTDWSSAISLKDMGAITSDPVLATVAGHMYGFRGKFAGVRVRQAGATPAAAVLSVGTM